MQKQEEVEIAAGKKFDGHETKKTYHSPHMAFFRITISNTMSISKEEVRMGLLLRTVPGAAHVR
jgi:hypothetical protein